MKTILKSTVFSAFLLMLAGGLVSCNRETPIPFTWISLAGTEPPTCDYRGNLIFDNSVKIINSLEELENYIDCPENRFLDIDFSRYSLLIASGVAGGVSPCGFPRGFVKKNENTYILRVSVGTVAVDAMIPWASFVLVPKISGNAEITLATSRTTSRIPC